MAQTWSDSVLMDPSGKASKRLLKSGQGSELYRMPTQDAHFLVTRVKQAASKQCRLNPEIGAI